MPGNQILAEVSKWLAAYAGLEADLNEQRPFPLQDQMWLD